MRQTERERERESKRKSDSEGKASEGERARKNMLGTNYAYKMYKSVWNETSLLKSVHVYVTFYRIKPYQPFNQTRTSKTHNQTTFSLSLYNHQPK